MDNLLKELNQKLQERYSGVLVDLNKHLQVVQEIDGDNNTKMFNIPTFELEVVANDTGKALISFKQAEQLNASYKVQISTSELTVANANKPYFDYMMDSILNKAIPMYQKTYGNFDVYRFGTNYLTFSFKEIETDLYLVLEGKFAKV